MNETKKSIKIENNVGDDIKVTVNYTSNGGTKIIIDPADKENSAESMLSTLECGKRFSRNGIEYIVIKHLENGSTLCIKKDALVEDRKFGLNNDWRESSLKEYLNGEYLTKLEDDFGEDNIVSHTVNLLSLDGLDDYGTDDVKVSVPTIDLYRYSRKLLGENLDRSWWLVTPDSTPSGAGSVYVRYVCGGGDVGFHGCGWGLAVRPVFALKSEIFVSQ